MHGKTKNYTGHVDLLHATKLAVLISNFILKTKDTSWFTLSCHQRVFACDGTPEVHSTHHVVSFHQAGNMGKPTL
jgi:hypothetical protein